MAATFLLIWGLKSAVSYAVDLTKSATTDLKPIKDMTPSNSVAYNSIFVCLGAVAVVWTCAAAIFIRLYCVGLITYVLEGPAQSKK